MIGYKMISSEGVRWRSNQGGVFPLSPPSMLDNVNKPIAKLILKNYGALFLRWESDFDQIEDHSWWHIIKETPDMLESLPKKTRYMIRRASMLYEARPLGAKEILEHGYDVYVSAYQRYETHEAMLGRSEFCEAIKRLPEQTEWWGVFEIDSRRLVAFSENYIEEETCFYVTMWLEPEAMKKFAGYLLFYKMECYYLIERSFKYISNGAKSLSHDTNIHDFLISKFNFRKAYARLHVIYTPWLRAAIVVLYPFRYWIEKVPFSPFKKAAVLLYQEEIHKRCC